MLAAVCDPSARAAAIGAHETGVAAALDYLEAQECQARRGSGGQTIVRANGFAGAVCTHELSRSGDPHLHTHVVIANLVRADDGRLSAPDMRTVYAAAKTAGTIAEAVMRAELTKTLGVEWGPVTLSHRAHHRSPVDSRGGRAPTPYAWARAWRLRGR